MQSVALSVAEGKLMGSIRINRGEMAISILSSFIVFAFLLIAFQRSAAFEVLNAMVVAVGVGVTVGFTIAAWHTLWARLDLLSAGDVLVLGIWLLWIGLVGAFFSLWMFRLTDDHWWLNAEWTAATRWLIFCGGALHLAAAGAIEGRIPRKSYVRAGVIAAFGVAFGLFLISFGVE
jgi:hypothetical protein